MNYDVISDTVADVFLDMKYELGGKSVLFYYAKELKLEMILLKNTSVANVLSGRNRHAILI